MKVRIVPVRFNGEIRYEVVSEDGRSMTMGKTPYELVEWVNEQGYGWARGEPTPEKTDADVIRELEAENAELRRVMGLMLDDMGWHTRIDEYVLWGCESMDLARKLIKKGEVAP